MTAQPSLWQPLPVTEAFPVGTLVRSTLTGNIGEVVGTDGRRMHRLVRGGKPTGIVYRWEDDSSLPNETDWDRLCEVLPSLGSYRPEVPPPPARDPRQVERVDRNWWEWPRSFHSVKPPAFLDVVEQVSPGPYVELFARQPRLGWDSWGYGYEIGESA